MAKQKQAAPVYTYRGGKKILLKKRPDQFVVRLQPEELSPDIGSIERVSAASTRVTVAPRELERRMEESREVAPTHHAYQYADAGADPAKMYQNGSNHGTSCAGVIAAEVDAQLTVGAAPGCRLLPIKWESSGASLYISDSKLRSALDYLADKVDVISNSWGTTPTASWSTSTRNRIRQLAQTGGRRGRGIIFLWAAGNENCPISHSASQIVPYDSGWDSTGTAWVGVSKARDFSNDLVGIPGVMHIAALASSAQRSHYSNYGTGIEVCAPSSNSHKYRRLQLPGRGITTTHGPNVTTDRFGGTSSATPLVAGVAALVISVNPQLTSMEVIGILKQTASKDLNLTGWQRTPPTSYDPNTSWDISPVAPFQSGAFQNISSPDGTWSPWFGHGKVDAVAAVRRALEQAGNRTVHVSAAATVDLSIPDNNPVGVVSRMNISDDGTIQSLKVSVDIEHTYIGDLQVRVSAPDGRRANLHSRSGASARNLVKTYDEISAPGLAAMRGAVIRGVWSLEITDLAAVDQGKLRQWRVDADVVGDGVLRQESTPGVTIPDNDPAGISDSLAIADPRTIADIAVEVDITHTYIGDLKIELRGPDGTRATLHDRSGQGADNLQRTFRLTDTAALNPFVGRPAAGAWTLAAADVAGQDIGKLNRWALAIR